MTPNPPPSRPRRSHFALTVLPLLVLALVTALGMAAVQIQGAVRAFERSANQTANVHLQAINTLLQYAHKHDESEWRRYRDVMRIPETARQTRKLLLNHGPEALPQVEKLMIEGGRDPRDVAAMLTLYRWFGQTFISNATRTGWRQTDRLIEQLEQQAQHLHAAIRTGAAAEQEADILQRISELDATLRANNHKLTASWASASRTTSRALQIGMAVIATLLAIFSALMIRRSLLAQARHTRSLTEAQRRWELASSAAGLGRFQLTVETGEIQLDAAAAAMHGLVAQPVTLTRDIVRSLIVDDNRPCTRQELDETLQTDSDYRITYRVRHPNGEVRTLEACGRRIPPDRDGGARSVGVLRDVSEAARQAEQDLKREAAERIAQAQRSFLSRLSHELRTPLNAILGFAQLLKMEERHPLTDTQQRQVQWILNAGRQLLALIEDVLDLSKVEAGEITLNLESVDVNALVQECLPLLDAARQPHQVTILNRTDDTALLAQVDAQRLRQIVINLLSNACKYNRPQGHVTIDTRQDGEDIVIEIGDDGIGMSAEDAAQLFQPFKRVASSAGYAEGTGLGLYIVKQLVERMQGQVSVVSEPDVGTRFTVRLPVAQAEALVA